MIRTIYIRDYALIDELEVAFTPGLNILTGQTGAGKSIIIGALNMILGERADTEVIRQGASKAIAEGRIDAAGHEEIRQILEENEVEYSPELLLRREIRPGGSRAFINDTPVTIQVLKSVGNYLVDLHGQHDHQLLLNEESHASVIDAFDSVSPHLAEWEKSWHEISITRKNLRDLRNRERELKEKMELWKFQVNELEQAGLDPVEEKELEEEMTLLDNAEELDRKAGEITELGSGEKGNLIDLLNQVKLHLEDLARIEKEFENYLDEVSAARISVREAVQFAERYRSRIEFNPQRLEQLRQRQSELNRLRKKYGRDIPELISWLDELRHELKLADNFDLEIEKLEKIHSGQKQQLRTKAVSLHEARVKAGEELSRGIVEKLKHLGIPHPQFHTAVEWHRVDNGWLEIGGLPVQCTESGCDLISFHISTNRGEDPKPLAKIASGGEVSRVMLAMKSIIARQQRLPVMIFDEIDTGISGHISEKTGREMRSLATECQIIAITHQPQIASQAHSHYRVEKSETEGRTVSRIIALSDEEHITEIAALMSGEEITESAMNSARELIQRNTFPN
ncbi:MAG: DNA repair protein RecN [Balneolaceae bacterium]